MAMARQQFCVASVTFILLRVAFAAEESQARPEPVGHASSQASQQEGDQQPEQSVQAQRDGEQGHYAKYMGSYLPPGDSNYTDKWTGDSAAYNKYMSAYSGAFANYSSHQSKYGGQQADYAQYVDRYARMAGDAPSADTSWTGKEASQRSAYDKSMASTMLLYVPGDYQHFAMQSTSRGGNTSDTYDKFIQEYAQPGSKDGYKTFVDRYGSGGYLKYFEQYAANSQNTQRSGKGSYEGQQFANPAFFARSVDGVQTLVGTPNAAAMLGAEQNGTNQTVAGQRASSEDTPEEEAETLVHRIEKLAWDLKNRSRDRQSMEQSAEHPATVAIEVASKHRAAVEAMASQRERKAAMHGLVKAELHVLHEETLKEEASARHVARSAQVAARHLARQVWKRAAHMKDQRKANEFIGRAEAAADMAERHGEEYARSMEDLLRKRFDEAAKDATRWAEAAEVAPPAKANSTVAQGSGSRFMAPTPQVDIALSEVQPSSTSRLLACSVSGVAAIAVLIWMVRRHHRRQQSVAVECLLG